MEKIRHTLMLMVLALGFSILLVYYFCGCEENLDLYTDIDIEKIVCMGKTGYSVNDMTYAKPKKISNKMTYTSDSNVFLSESGFASQCVTGHLNNMQPMCGIDGCLHTITAPPRKTKTMPVSIKDELNKIHGWMSFENFDVVKLLTEMQWSFGIYGSVGEIGVFDGRFTAILAYFTATEKGERLFICDIFGKTEHMKLKTEDARKERFEKNMNKVGFSMYTEQESKRIRSWEDSSMYLTKALYRQMQLPTFRFYSIDGSHHAPYVMNDLRHVTCVLRKGGIIASDDILNDVGVNVLKSHQQFFQIFGGEIIKPLLLTGGKLYICDASWHPLFMMYILRHNSKYTKITDNKFGATFTYLK